MHLTAVQVLIASTASTPLPCATAGNGRVCAAPWEFVGPAGYRDDSTPPIPDGGGGLLSASAIEAVAGPTATAKNWFVGTVNGGVWRTDEASLLSAAPVWVSATDGQPVRCSSISAVAVFGDVVFAGCGGSTSSEMGANSIVLNDGDWGGVMRSTDSGMSWSMAEGFPTGYYVSKIVALDAQRVLISARSHYKNESDGGLWRSEDGGDTFARVLSLPTFDLAALPLALGAPASTGAVFAAIALDAASTVLKSEDGGLTFASWSRGLDWKGHVPFYPCLALGAGGPLAPNSTVLFVGALAVDPADSRKTSSGLFWRPLDADPREDTWLPIANAPALDDDAMPKDRMALLVDPRAPEVLYVAGNGDNIAYRVEWKSGVWSDLTVNDTIDGSSPHCDCRNFAWVESSSNGSDSSNSSEGEASSAGPSLLLVSDGGVWRRTHPAQASVGKWLSANGDIGAMEILSASWDAGLSRWIGGAQDNDVQLAPPGTAWNATATGVVMGDGTLTAVDNTLSPARLFGTRQFLGQRDIDGVGRARGAARRGGVRGGADAPGFMFATGDPPRVVGIPIESTFPDPEGFPYFVMPYALNSQRPSDLVVWVNGTRGQQSAFWRYTIPSSASVKSADIMPPQLEAGTGAGTVLDFVVGGFTVGKSDPSVLVAMNSTHLYHRSTRSGGVLTVRALPTAFAPPVVLTYDADGNVVLGPVSHGQTVHLAVDPSDSSTVVVTGWPSTTTITPASVSSESIWISTDAGATWSNVIGNLVNATATIAMARPSGLLLVPLGGSGSGDNATALLVGTVSGVYISWLEPARRAQWTRLGSCADLPLVLTMGITYEHFSDSVVAATMGRGVYRLPNASSALLRSRLEQSPGAAGGCLARDAALAASDAQSRGEQSASRVAALFAPRRF